ncbi:hypothetical protein [Nonlabens sp. MIC269]|nr:hypothetical protein [Nonlabens sp. MIC269]
MKKQNMETTILNDIIAFAKEVKHSKLKIHYLMKISNVHPE